MEENREVNVNTNAEMNVNVTTEASANAGENNVLEVSRKHFSKLGWGFLIGSVIITVVQYLVSLAVNIWKPEWLTNTTISLLLSVVSMYLVGMPIMIALVYRVPATVIPKKKMKVSHFLLALIMSYSLMYCSNIVGLILTTIIGVLKGSAVNNAVLNVVSDTNVLVIILYMVILAPIMEELVFRKLIVDRTARYGQGVSIVVSGLMFGLFHGNLNQFVYATVLGMFFAFLYVKTGNIKVSIGVHMFINFMGGLVSTLLLKAINYGELVELTYGGAGTEELMEFYMANLPGLLAFILYGFFVFVIVITGIVLLIVFHKRFKLEKGEIVIPKGRRFDIVFINMGMLVFCLFWIGMIIVQLFIG